MRTTTDRAFVGLVIACTALGACSRHAPPFEKFDVTTDIPAMAGKAVPTPPDVAFHPWKVWINQERPRQKKNPEWHAYGPKDGALLDLAPDGKWRCLVNPVHIFGRVNERAAISDWSVSRTVRCSGDDFRTYAETSVAVAFDPSGAPVEAQPPAAVYLNDVVNGEPRSTVVVLKSEVPARARERE